MKFKTVLLASLLVISVSHAQGKDANATSKQESNLSVKDEAIKYMKMLGGAHKTQLKGKIKEGKTDPQLAEYCAGVVPDLDKGVNASIPKYAHVRRTSLKVRNTSRNTPDQLDTKILNDYAEKESNKTFKPNDIVVVKDGNTTRVYKPLVAGKVCLKCHGDITPEVKSVLSKVYPDDKATGYKEGDFRGVVVVDMADH